MINIKYKENNFEYENPVPLFEITDRIKDDFEGDVVAAFMDNKVCSLNSIVSKDSEVEFFDNGSVHGNRVYVRGLCFLFCKAVKDVLNCDVKIIRVMGNELYSEILSNTIISETTVEKIKLRMKELVEQEIPIEKIVVSRLEAMNYYKNVNQLDKANSMKYMSTSSLSLYKMDDTLDYFYGIMPINTKVLKNYELKYIKENRVVLIPPSIYDEERSSKYLNNESIIKSTEENNKFLENINIINSCDLDYKISNSEYNSIIDVSEMYINKKIYDLAHKISKDKDAKVILINGPTSSGKTIVARKLTTLLKSDGYDPITISIDDFYREDTNDYSRENIDNIDTNLFNNTLDSLLAGNEVKMPAFDFEVHQRYWQDNAIKLNDKSVIIIEGMHAFNSKLTEMIQDKNKFKVFVTPFTPLNIDNHNLFRTSDNRLLRKLVKDAKIKNINPSDSLKDWRRIRKIEEETINPYANDADEFINTSLVYELGILKTYAEPLLFSINEDDENYEEALRILNIFRVILPMPSENVPSDSILREFIGGSCFGNE